MDLGSVKSKGHKRKKPEAFRVGAIVTSQWGLCSVIALAEGGYNCDFGDGKFGGWYVLWSLAIWRLRSIVHALASISVRCANKERQEFFF